MRAIAVVAVLVALAASVSAAEAKHASRCLNAAATITGTARNDVLRGTAHADVIAGLGGNDRLIGLGGNDLMCGGDGDDEIEGGAGRDRADGGAGHNDCVAVERTTHCTVSQLAPLTIHIEGIRVSDDDGGRLTEILPAQFATWVARANEVYAGARIRFIFSPAGDWGAMRSTAVNNSELVLSFASLNAAKSEASRHPGKLVVFLRHGPGDDQTTTSFASSELGFVVGVSFDARTIITGTLSRGIPVIEQWPYVLAHELGHVFGLAHTFPGNGAATESLTKAYVHVLREGPSALDGDGIADTPPDAGAMLYVNEGWDACGSIASYVIAGFTFTPDRRNLMGNFGCGPSHLTPGQLRVAREGAAHYAS